MCATVGTCPGVRACVFDGKIVIQTAPYYLGYLIHNCCILRLSIKSYL